MGVGVDKSVQIINPVAGFYQSWEKLLTKVRNRRGGYPSLAVWQRHASKLLKLYLHQLTFGASLIAWDTDGVIF
jgi:hypothetical protein